ncbi:MAG: hypothetical protein ACYDEG_05175 [bacterium]
MTKEQIDELIGIINKKVVDGKLKNANRNDGTHKELMTKYFKLTNGRRVNYTNETEVINYSFALIDGFKLDIKTELVEMNKKGKLNNVKLEKYAGII